MHAVGRSASAYACDARSVVRAEGAAMLEAWLAEAQRIARRRRRGAMDRVADPPAGLTPDDCAAAGFKRYGHYFVRNLPGIKVRINFSPDLDHQAVFLERSNGRRGAVLWIDGRPAPLPVDADGHPRSGF
jgi:hypothetical protein